MRANTPPLRRLFLPRRSPDCMLILAVSSLGSIPLPKPSSLTREAAGAPFQKAFAVSRMRHRTAEPCTPLAGLSLNPKPQNAGRIPWGCLAEWDQGTSDNGGGPYPPPPVKKGVGM